MNHFGRFGSILGAFLSVLRVFCEVGLKREELSLFKLSKSTKERTQLLSRKIYKKERN